MMRIRSILSGQRRTALLLLTVTLWVALAGWMFGTHGWGSLPAVADACGGPAPDVRFAPSPETTRSFIDGCRSAHEVDVYARLQVLDVAYPALVAAALALILLTLTRSWPRLRRFAVVPVIASVGDYVENVGAWRLISGGDPAWALYAVQAGSLVKTALSWCAWLAVLGLVAATLAARWSRRPTRPAVR